MTKLWVIIELFIPWTIFDTFSWSLPSYNCSQLRWMSWLFSSFCSFLFSPTLSPSFSESSMIPSFSSTGMLSPTSILPLQCPSMLWWIFRYIFISNRYMVWKCIYLKAIGRTLPLIVGPLPLLVAITIRILFFVSVLSFLSIYWIIMIFRLIVVFKVRKTEYFLFSDFVGRSETQKDNLHKNCPKFSLTQSNQNTNYGF